MTQNRRIALNIIATYGRSLYAVVIGLVAGRWTLMSLGEVDYGLFGLIGGLIAFVSFLNGLMASAVARYYAYAVGEGQKDEIVGLRKCREWFSTAIVIHTILPIVLVLLGYPCGIWAIENYLSIPADKILACVWVWRFACLSCFVSMLNVPFQAMYTAKQEIAELTIYGVAATTINFLFLCYMITHQRPWLVRYAAWSCFVAILPQSIICIRAIFAFKECRLVSSGLWSWTRAKELFSFAAGRFVCALALMVRTQGWAIQVNKFLGPARNAAMTIGTNLSTQSTMLTTAMSNAFFPAITNACGAGDLDRMRSLCYKMCKFGTLSVLIFAMPLIIEADNVLVLWLKNPPVGAATLCICLVIDHCICRLVDGHWMGVFAVGKMAGFNATESLGYFFAFCLSWVMMALGLDISAVGLSAIICSFYTIAVKLYYGRKHCALSVRLWFAKIAMPLSIISAISLGAGFFVRLRMNPTFLRVMLTTCVCELVLLTLTWFIVCDKSERNYILSRITRRSR